MLKPVITIYGQPNCPHCVRAKGYLDGLKLKYSYVDITEGGNREKLNDLLGYKVDTVPKVMIGQAFIGGAQELVALPVKLLQQMVGGR